MSIVLTGFARTRLFPREPRRNTIQDCTPEQFERHLNEVPPLEVLDGYAPFCKLHVHRNWTSTRCLAVLITDANRHLLRSGYEARTKDELPVLVRWFEGLEPPRAHFLIPILYSRAQLANEGTLIEADWGVVGCMYTAEPEETPMAPITIMRNALGVEGGRIGRAAGPRGLPAQRRVLADARELAGVGAHDADPATGRGGALDRACARMDIRHSRCSLAEANAAFTPACRGAHNSTGTAPNEPRTAWPVLVFATAAWRHAAAPARCSRPRAHS